MLCKTRESLPKLWNGVYRVLISFYDPLVEQLVVEGCTGTQGESSRFMESQVLFGRIHRVMLLSRLVIQSKNSSVSEAEQGCERPTKPSTGCVLFGLAVLLLWK